MSTVSTALKDWLSGTIENELKAALGWQQQQARNGSRNRDASSVSSDKVQARDKPLASHASSGRPKKYQDNGSTLRIACQRDDTRMRCVQLVKFLSFDAPYICRFSDSYTVIKAKMSSSVSEKYAKEHDNQSFSKHTQGAFLLLLDFDIVFSRSMTGEERLTLLIKEFDFKGAPSKSVLGAPTSVQNRIAICELLEKLEGRAQPDGTAKASVTASITEVPIKKSPSPEATNSQYRRANLEEGSAPLTLGSQLVSQAVPHLTHMVSQLPRISEPEVVIHGGTNLQPQDGSRRVGMDVTVSKGRKQTDVDTLRQLLGGLRHGFSKPQQNSAPTGKQLPTTLHGKYQEEQMRDSATTQFTLVRGNGSVDTITSGPSVRVKRENSEDIRSERHGSEVADELTQVVSPTPIVQETKAPNTVEKGVAMKAGSVPDPGVHAVTPTLHSGHTIAVVMKLRALMKSGQSCPETMNEQGSECVYDRGETVKLAHKHPVPSQSDSADVGIALKMEHSPQREAGPSGRSTYLHERNFRFVRTLSAADRSPVDQCNLLKRPESWLFPLPGHRLPSPNVPIAVLKAFNATFDHETRSRDDPRLTQQNLRPSSLEPYLDIRQTPTATQRTSDSERGLDSAISPGSQFSGWFPTPSKPANAGGGTILPPDSSAAVASQRSASSVALASTPSSRYKYLPKSRPVPARDLENAKRSSIQPPSTKSFAPLPSDDSDLEMTVPRPLPMDMTGSSPSQVTVRDQYISNHRNETYHRLPERPPRSLSEATDPRRELRNTRAGESTPPELVIPGSFQPESLERFRNGHIRANHDSAVQSDISDFDHTPTRQRVDERNVMMQQRRQQSDRTTERTDVRDRASANIAALKRSRDTLPGPDRAPAEVKKSRHYDLGLGGSSQPPTQPPAQAARQARHEFYGRHRPIINSLDTPNREALHTADEGASRRGSAPSTALSAAPKQLSQQSRSSPAEFSTPNRPALSTSAKVDPRLPDSAPSSLQSRTTVFERFQNAYQMYSGNLKHFQSLCRKVDSEPMLHRSLWDDFVIRHKMEYSAYSTKRTEDGEDTVPYEQFYRDEIEGPVHNLRILNPNTLKDALTEAQITTPSTPIKSTPSVEILFTSPPATLDQSGADTTSGQLHAETSRQEEPTRHASLLEHRDSVTNDRPAANGDPRYLDTYRPTYTTPYRGHGSRPAAYSPRSSRRLPWPGKSQTSKQKIAPPSSGAHHSKDAGSPPIFADPRNRARDSRSISSRASSEVRSVLPCTEVQGSARKPAVVGTTDSGLEQTQEHAATPDAWWMDDHTPFKQFARDYSRLKEHNGVLGRPGKAQVLELNWGRLNVLDWQL